MKNKYTNVSPDLIEFLMPQPAVFDLTYKTDRGDIRRYNTVVIEKCDGYFTGYVYGRGVRSFRYDRVLEMQKVK